MSVVRTGQVVDTPSAEEFGREILQRASVDDLAGVAADLDRKSAAVTAVLGDDPARLDRDGLRTLLRWVFASRRKADAILDAVGPAQLAEAVAYLLTSGASLTDRFARLDELLDGFPAPAFDLPGELLHFAEPDRYWLWTRWIWDPRVETGALRLVTLDEVDLWREQRGDIYLAVGEAMAFVHETGRAAGLVAHDAGPFGTDVFLAAVYGVYMNTVLHMRMTQEFNRLVPPLPDLVRRLLGVYHLEES